MINKLENPLVTVVVITYNSSQYVIETLESTKQQTYKNIELVITDDCSTDNTAELCREWLKENSIFFHRSLLVVNKINKGVAGNCNSGLKNSEGNWIKIIAGDDLLINTCIEDYVNFALENQFKLFFAYPEILLENPNQDFSSKRERYYRSTQNFFNQTAYSQFLTLLTTDVLPMNPATIFFNAEFVNALGGFDERFLPEDLPLYLKATNTGNQLGLMEKNTVKYRIHNSSLTFKGKSEGAINVYWYETKKKIKSPYITRKLFFARPLIVWEYYNIMLWKKLTLVLGNKKSVWKVLRMIRIASPLYIIKKFN